MGVVAGNNMLLIQSKVVCLSKGKQVDMVALFCYLISQVGLGRQAKPKTDTLGGKSYRVHETCRLKHYR